MCDGHLASPDASAELALSSKSLPREQTWSHSKEETADQLKTLPGSLQGRVSDGSSRGRQGEKPLLALPSPARSPGPKRTIICLGIRRVS